MIKNNKINQNLYVIRREDFFKAKAEGQLKHDVIILGFGSLWMNIFLSDEEKINYRFPIEPCVF